MTGHEKEKWVISQINLKVWNAYSLQGSTISIPLIVKFERKQMEK